MSEIASELELKALRAMEKAMIKNAELQAKLDMAIETLEWYSKYYRKPAMVEIGRKLAQETLDKLERKDDEL